MPGIVYVGAPGSTAPVVSSVVVTPVVISVPFSLAPGEQLGGTAFDITVPSAMSAVVTVAPSPSELMTVGGNVSRIAVVNVTTGATVPCQLVGPQLECEIRAAGSYTTVLLPTTLSPVVQQGVSQGPASAP
jgi:hypothetical protein